jgi:hypothetical protein
MKFLISTATLGLATALCLAAPASADPKGDLFPVVCENGVTYMVTANGNGAWTPAHDSTSNSILIPTSFTAFHGVVTDSTGTVLDTVDDPPSAKGMSGKHSRSTTTSCTFEIVEHFTDPELGELTFTGTGGVTGFITPLG